MENPHYEQVVHEAAVWLDGVEPGWHKKIDRAELDMSSCFRCVLGQVFGAFHEGVNLMNADDTREGGLISAFDVFGDEDRKFYPHLAQLWLAEIAARLEADKAKSADAFIERTNEIINESLEEVAR